MDNRNKDELAEKNRKLQEEIKNMPPLPEDAPPSPEPTPDPIPEDLPDEEPEITPVPVPDPTPEPDPEPEPAPTPAPEPPKPPAPAPKPEPTPEERLKQQQREGIILHKKNEQFAETVEEAAKIDITDEELKKEFPNYDEMTTGEQLLAKRALLSDKRFTMIHATVQADKKVKEWGDKVEVWLADEKNHISFPALNGRDEEFKRFCSKEQHRNIDIALLAKSFLFDFTPPAPKKGSLMNTGSGGGNNPQPKKEAYTPEQIKWYREHQPRYYQKLVKEGKANIEI